MTKDQIEQEAADFLDIIRKSYPNKTETEIACIMGYFAAYFLNLGQSDSMFRNFGAICYDILTYKELTNGVDTRPTSTDEHRSIGDETQEMPTGN